jgi:hypothetical protein
LFACCFLCAEAYCLDYFLPKFHFVKLSLPFTPFSNVINYARPFINFNSFIFLSKAYRAITV